MCIRDSYPGEPSEKTIEQASIQGPVFKEEGFGTFFVPQGKKGDIDDLLTSFMFASQSPELIDYIGISILAAPLAYNVEQGNNLQRFNSRLRLMHALKERYFFQAEDGIRDSSTSRGLGDVYKRQYEECTKTFFLEDRSLNTSLFNCFF